MNTDINVLVYTRGPERYIWLYRDDQLPDVQRSLGRLAMNHDVPFTWLDAAKVAREARRQIQEPRERLATEDARNGRRE